MRLAVVIPVLNEEGGVAECVRAAWAIDSPELPVKAVIVADGGSRDRSAQRAEAAGAVVVSSARGRGTQLRAALGAHVTTGETDATDAEVVLMLHADTRLDPDAGRQIAAALAAGAGCGAFRQRIDAPGRVYRLIESGNAFRARRLGLPYGDQAIFARRDLLDRVGGVPDLPLMEDVALMQRLRRIAWPVLLPGPVEVSARRWRRHGVVRQTLRNWALLAAFAVGVPAERLVGWYRPDGDATALPTDGTN